MPATKFTGPAVRATICGSPLAPPSDFDSGGITNMNARRFAFATITTTVLLMGLPLALTAQDVQTDWDKSKNFGEYHTYYWAKIDSPNPLMNQRLQDAVDAQLEKKGWSKQQAGGQVALIALGTTKTKKDLNTFYSGTGWGYGGWGRPRSSTTSVTRCRGGTLRLGRHGNS